MMQPDGRERPVDEVFLLILEREGRLRPMGEPSTDLEALMATAPGFEPEPSYESRMEQMDTLYCAMRGLDDEELYLMEAYFYEGLSFRQIGRRMGYGVRPNWGKSTAERKVKKAIKSMRRQLGVEAVGEVVDGRSVTVQEADSFSEGGDGKDGDASLDDPSAERPAGEDLASSGTAEGERE